MLEVTSEAIRSIIYLILLDLLSNREKKNYFDRKSLFICAILTIVQIAFASAKLQNFKYLMPIFVMLVLTGYELWENSVRKIKNAFAIIMEVYALFFFGGSVVACICGIYEFVSSHDMSVRNQMLVMISMRMLMLCALWVKYGWIQNHLQNLARYIMVIFGAFLLFFEQFFWMAHIKDNNVAMKVLTLMIYFTILFTAIMNLQHKYLTADNQRILDDNQRMSQEIHRSRDVIDVVSRVVATEDTIDPKLRQELADFCKSEKQEMFDPDLAASLIGDTGMDLLNALLRDKLCQCRQQEISFEVMIPEPIDTYVSDIGIGEAELLRVINDLVKNAVTAINKTDGEVREILLILAVGPSDCLELCVYDSGVPFPDFILERFGERGNTTTGTGNGLADTVNTLRTYDASIEIEAIEPGTDIYTKCVRICFDGKNEIHI